MLDAGPSSLNPSKLQSLVNAAARDVVVSGTLPAHISFAFIRDAIPLPVPQRIQFEILTLM